MSTDNLAREAGLSAEARKRLQLAVDAAGGQSAIARQMSISRQGLNAVLRAGKGLSVRRLAAICDAVGVSIDYILDGPSSGDGSVDIVQIPIVEIEASAGPGLRTSTSPSTVDHLPMPMWLARRLGEVGSLQVVTARGDSGSPDINDSDLVMLDTSKSYRGEGMYVIVFDGDLAIKRLQKSGLGMKLMSRNAAYDPVDVPAAEVDDRLRVLGRVVWSGRQW